jgi:hypothetical protein
LFQKADLEKQTSALKAQAEEAIKEKAVSCSGTGLPEVFLVSRQRSMFSLFRGLNLFRVFLFPEGIGLQAERVEAQRICFTGKFSQSSRVNSKVGGD